MSKKKLTGWLILLIVLIGPLGFGTGMSSLRTIETAYRPLRAEYPSIRTATMVFQLLVGAGTFAWLYAAWILYRREAGTLSRAMTAFSFGTFLRLSGGFAVPLLGGLPPTLVQKLLSRALPGILIVFLFTGAWLIYLSRSSRVRDIYVA